MVWKATGWKGALISATLSGALSLGAALLPGGTAQARDWDDHCRARIRAEERELDRNIRRHGFFSRQAERDRRELVGLRSQCRDERHGRRWDRDWDDRGRHRGWDRDRDRDDRGRHRGWDRDRDDRGRHLGWDRDRR